MRRYMRNPAGYGGSGFGFGYALTPVVKRLLLANVAVFLLTAAIGGSLIVELFSFQLYPGIVTRPWGVITYMFVHADFMHIFVNMLGLFFFGPPLEAKWGSREFTKFYLVAGMGAVALSFLNASSLVIGASGAVFGVMLAFALNWPNAPIYVWGIFPVQAKWLVGFFFVMSLFGTFGSQGGGVAHFAHLGGLVTGFAYLKLDWRLSSTVGRAKRSVRKVRRLAIVPREPEEEKVVGESEAGLRAREEERRMLDAVDQVLDKISEHGMSSLTAAERKLLDEVSRRHRTN